MLFIFGMFCFLFEVVDFFLVRIAFGVVQISCSTKKTIVYMVWARKMCLQFFLSIDGLFVQQELMLNY